MAMYETYKSPLIAATLIIVSILVYLLFALPDRRSTKAGNSIHDLPKGVDKLERRLDDHTLEQKLGDAVKDIHDKNNNPSA